MVEPQPKPVGTDYEKLHRIDNVCDKFESGWLANSRPDLVAHLSMVPKGDRAQLLLELVRMDVEYRQQAGEQPVAADYVRVFPDYQGEISRAFSDGRTIKSIYIDDSANYQSHISKRLGPIVGLMKHFLAWAQPDRHFRRPPMLPLAPRYRLGTMTCWTKSPAAEWGSSIGRGRRKRTESSRLR